MAPNTMLIPLDGSEWSRQMVPIVLRMLRPEDYAITLLRVADEPAGVLAEPPQYVPFDHEALALPWSAANAERVAHPIYQNQIEATVRATLEDELQSDVYYLEGAGFDVTTEIRFGDPTQEIIGFVRSNDIDLVAMATHGRTGVQRFVLGSVAEDVLRHVTVPVLLMRPIGETTGEAAV